jgi:hypothetical protein
MTTTAGMSRRSLRLALRAQARRIARELGAHPEKLPCGCYLFPCPCCGLRTLVVGLAETCALGGPQDAGHGAWTEAHEEPGTH